MNPAEHAVDSDLTVKGGEVEGQLRWGAGDPVRGEGPPPGLTSCGMLRDRHGGRGEEAEGEQCLQPDQPHAAGEPSLPVCRR